MAVTVEFITLGDASNQLNVPASTLRLWTDDLEKSEVHYVKRNHRDERIYYENDLEIFSYMKELKKEHGRKTRTKDIALMIYQQSVENNRFELRRSEDAPKPKVSTTAMDMLHNDDIQKLMDSDRVKQFISIIMAENANALDSVTEELDNVKGELSKVKGELEEKVGQLKDALSGLQQEQEANTKKIDESIEESRKARIEREEEAKKPKGFFAKLFS